MTFTLTHEQEYAQATLKFQVQKANEAVAAADQEVYRLRKIRNEAYAELKAWELANLPQPEKPLLVQLEKTEEGDLRIIGYEFTSDGSRMVAHMYQSAFATSARTMFQFLPVDDYDVVYAICDEKYPGAVQIGDSQLYGVAGDQMIDCAEACTFKKGE